MDREALLQSECIKLLDRVNRSVDVQLSCLFYRGRYCVVLMAAPDLLSNLLFKNAKNFARQLIELIGANPGDVDFILYQRGEEPEWSRWRFQWADNSPLQVKSVPMSVSSQRCFLEPLLQQGVVQSLRSKQIPHVA